MKRKRTVDITDIIPIALGVVALIIGIIITIIGRANLEEKTEANQYPLTTIVTEINEEKDSVSITDNNGFVWQFYGVEDWEEGDICSVIMNDNGTETIFDDIIITTRYGGKF